jgi:hypothetical protein
VGFADFPLRPVRDLDLMGSPEVVGIEVARSYVRETVA